MRPRPRLSCAHTHVDGAQPPSLDGACHLRQWRRSVVLFSAQCSVFSFSGPCLAPRPVCPRRCGVAWRRRHCGPTLDRQHFGAGSVRAEVAYSRQAKAQQAGRACPWPAAERECAVSSRRCRCLGSGGGGGGGAGGGAVVVLCCAGAVLASLVHESKPGRRFHPSPQSVAHVADLLMPLERPPALSGCCSCVLLLLVLVPPSQSQRTHFHS